MMALSANVQQLLDAHVRAASPHLTEGSSPRAVFVLAVDLYDIGGATTETLYFSSHRYRTSSSDTPANTLFRPRLIAPDLVSGLSFDADGLPTRVNRTVGVIKISNDDGVLDDYTDTDDYNWEGRNATLYVGGQDWDFTDFEVIAPAARIKDFQFGDSQIRFHMGSSLFDPDVNLQPVIYSQDLVQIHDSNNSVLTGYDYPNTFNIEATLYPDSLKESLDGRPVPTLLGTPKNIIPVLEDTNYSNGTSDGLYRYRMQYPVQDANDDEYPDMSAGPVNVYEGGVLGVEGTDWDYITRDLGDNSPTGEINVSEIVWYAKPVADIHIEPDQCQYKLAPSGGQDGSSGIVEIITRALVDLTAGQVPVGVGTSFAFYRNYYPGNDSNRPWGAYFTDHISRGEALDLCVSPRGWWGPSFDGSEFEIGLLRDFSLEVSALSLDTDSIVKMQRLKTAPPLKSVTLREGKNWPAPIGTILGAVDEEDRSLLSKDYRIDNRWDEDDAGDSVSTDFAASRDATIETIVQEDSNNTTDAQRVYELMSVQHDLYEATIVRGVGAVEIGDVVTVTYDRFGLDGGVKMLVVGIRLSPKNRNFKLTLWSM
jgi:hypothetical protein